MNLSMRYMVSWGVWTHQAHLLLAMQQKQQEWHLRDSEDYANSKGVIQTTTEVPILGY